MRITLMTFRYSGSLGGFDDTALIDFIRDKEMIAFREHFYTVNEVPHLSCIVHYQDAVVPPEALQAAREIPARTNDRRGRKGAPDPCEGLNESERALFNHLREWRAKLAHEDGMPPYVILTNKQMVAIIRKRPESPTALGHIEGLGPGKLERYGAAILQHLHGTPECSSSGEAQVASPENAPEGPVKPELTDSSPSVATP